MADPTPSDLDARLKAVEFEQLAHDTRIKALEDDDAKVHGAIQWINEKIISNPKASAAIVALASMLLTAIGAWWAARNNSMPGVVSEPAPVMKTVPEPKTSSKLDELQKSLKEQSK